IRVEQARPDDAGEILTLQRAAYVAEAQLYGDPFIAPLVESLEQIRRVLADANAVVLQAVAGPPLVGAVRAPVSDLICLIGRLVVAPDVQRSGIGSQLMKLIEAEVTDRASALVLFTGHQSLGNLRLYRRLGYAETHRERFAAHLTLVHMRKILSH